MAAHYETGYGKPPKRTQFKKGRSGNPAGRPKGSQGLMALQDKILGEKVLVTENGRRMKITKAELFMRKLWKNAMMGDPRTMRLALEQLRAATEREKTINRQVAPEDLTDEELAAIVRGDQISDED
jgi:hypothetical protein